MEKFTAALLYFAVLGICCSIFVLAEPKGIHAVKRTNNEQRILREKSRPNIARNRDTSVNGIKGIQFLLAVNQTWGRDNCSGCITTVKTPMLKPRIPANESERIIVGDCDAGPLTYDINPGKDGNMTIYLTFYSSVILDASHPTCTIPFSGGFIPPSKLGFGDGSLPTVLPGCSTAESREGYHMTYYWFYIYDWILA